ncbi:hypothetical protein PSACC_02519 [Paramicrosporidium saccamoebae]|uniref:25S rRNA (uridine-N(3))-methyltransferase BMT5-like domain-containing protein n=1 Tax=Paramicrosporidium saccamoebae TaxID=1246581 RepID=A0A2H9TJ63_9FUNG|nr:hypothetical protein PSACC_02519 [Paramicrosporidium saccamoebae]
MKRGRLQKSLARIIQSEAKRKTPPVPAEKVAKKDTRIVWHQWSDAKLTPQPYRPEDDSTVLVVGDGDFGFSAALLDTLPGSQILATVWDSESEQQRKYPDSVTHLRRLRDAGAQVLFSLDATKLSQKYFGRMEGVGRIVRIIFNFPHTGEGIKDRDYNIRAQQKLILGFLQSAEKMLREQEKRKMNYLTRNTVMKAAMAKDPKPRNHKDGDDDEEEEEDGNDGGQTIMQPEIHLTCWCGDPYDSWDVKKIARSVGLVLHESFSFDATRYVGYQHRRTIGSVADDVTFNKRPARTFVFTNKRLILSCSLLVCHNRFDASHLDFSTEEEQLQRLITEGEPVEDLLRVYFAIRSAIDGESMARRTMAKLVDGNKDGGGDGGIVNVDWTLVTSAIIAGCIAIATLV